MKLIALIFLTISPLLGSFAAAGCEGDGRTGYPAAWFTAVPRDGAPDWEILPQDAGPCEVILSKRGELGIFSNFAATPFTLDGVRYASLEGFWQMMKYPESASDVRANVAGVTWPMPREAVGQLTGFDAKNAGKPGSEAMKALGINWVSYQGKQLVYRTPEKAEHYELVVRATRAKLAENPAVKELLLKTGDLTLKPDHKAEPDQSPAWEYYKIWEMLRGELRSTSARY